MKFSADRNSRIWGHQHVAVMVVMCILATFSAGALLSRHVKGACKLAVSALRGAFVCVVLIAAPLPAGELANASALPSPAILPQPAHIASTGGTPLVLEIDSLTIIGRGASSESIDQAIRIIHQATGMKPKPPSKDAKAIGLSLILDRSVGKGRPGWQAAESYKLTVAADRSGVAIAACDAHGLFNGLQTFVQLAEKGADGKWRVPAVEVDDYPRFHWRGYLLDPARHFRSKQEVLRYLDLLAMHKMNVMQLHLTDDQGWRIEVKRYPALTGIGANVPDFSGRRGKGRFYSQQEMKEILDYAAARHVMILPEIEMPGHCGAATTACPELSCDGKTGSELCVGKDSTYEFMAAVLDEMAGLFPSPFIHVGADEVGPGRWRACPECRKRMDRLATSKPSEGIQRFRVTVAGTAGVPYNEDIALLEGDFVRRLDQHLAMKGKRLIGWDEILEGGLRTNSQAVVMAWRGVSAIAGAIEQGRDVVDAVYPDYYLDNDVSLARTYAVEPVPAGLSEEQARHILGVQCNMWGERTIAQEDVDRETFPRLCAVAETGWSPRSAKDFKDFSARLEHHANRLKPLGVAIRPAAKE